jgi:hypothetical protein
VRTFARVFAAMIAAAIAIVLVACNFIVDAQFAGKADASGADSGLPPASCTLGGGSPKNPICGRCMLTTCSQYWESMCKDGTNATGKATLGDCSDDPSVKDGLCERVWLPEAGAYASPNDPQTHYFNMRKCVTEQCRPACTTCDGLTYARYTGDTKGALLTPDVGPCAKCLLGNCTSVLIGKGTQFSHCCYQARIDATWGPCVRNPQNGNDQAPDCTAINTLAYKDAGANSGCDEQLSVCAVDNCSSECGL